MTRKLLVSVTFTICVLSPHLNADCPMPPVACEKLAKADLAFVGEVADVVHYREYNGNRLPRPVGIDQYRFNVTEALKGVELGEFQALFYYNPGADTNSFVPGRRYLVFAHRTVTGAFIADCAWSRELRRSEDEGVLVELRACLKQTP